MKFKNVFLLTTIPIILASCLGGGGGAGTNLAAIAGLSLPQNVEVLQDDNALSGNLAAVNSAAYNSTGTDYSKAKAEVWIDGGAWQDPLMMVDFLMCIMVNNGASLLPNSTFKSLVDMNKCSDDDTSGIPRFNEVISVSSRESNTSVQNVTAYIDDKTDRNQDGDFDDAFENEKVATEIVIVTAPTASNPYGAFTFNWNVTNRAANNHGRGSVSFSEESASQTRMKFIREDGNSGSNDYQYLSAKLNKDGSGGRVYVEQSAYGGSPQDFKVHYNSTHVWIAGSGSPQCYNLDESSMTPHVYSYNLYNSSTGALIDISAGLEFLHGSGKNERGYAGSYINTSGAIKHWIWTEDSSSNPQPTTIYKESDPSVSYSVAWTSGLSPSSLNGKPTITGMSFDEPIIFTASFTDSDGNTKNDDLNYEGPGQLWGIEWNQRGGSGSDPWLPAYTIADGALLTATNGNTYRVKQVGLWKVPALVSSGFCSGLNVSSSNFTDIDTRPTLSAVSTTWSSKPTITAKPRVIHGVKQY
jgi:hypothetical protein